MTVYLDHNATTPLDERVLEAMMPYLSGNFANPSSGHQAGRAARAAIDTAREQVAALVNTHPSQVVFTSGGTEANNFALKGVAARLQPGLLAVSTVEHDSVLGPVRALARTGWQMVEIAVDEQGQVDTERFELDIRQQPGLLAMMMANNETGVIYDVAGIANTARQHGAIVLTDAVQALGKIPVDFVATGAHMMSLSAHKIYGPKGAGALVIDKSLDMEPLLHGGGHEKGRRAGTENVAAIAGFGRAAELAAAELESRSQHMLPLREAFEQQLKEQLPQARVFCEQQQRLPNTTFFAIPGVDGATLLMALDQAGFAVSSGSACGTGKVEPSHVLQAMDVEPALARGAVRMSLGKDTRPEEIKEFVSCLKQQVKHLQSLGSLACA